MEARRLTERNRIRNKIREITKYIETDTNTINRLRFLQTNIEFNRNQIEKLSAKNKDRERLLDELKERSEDLELGKLDDELEEKHLEIQREVKKKDNEAKKRKQDLKDIKKADKERSDARRKITIEESRAERFYKREVERGEKYFFKICESIPDYILKKLEKMPKNKGYIWKGIYCFGKLPSDTENKTVFFERKKNSLYIHEWYPGVIEIWEKPERSRKVLISRTQRKKKNSQRSVVNWNI